MKSGERRARARKMRGVRAGLISRLMADAIDLAIVALLLFGALVAAGVVMYMLGDGRFRLPDVDPLFTAIAYPVIEIIYLSYMWGSRGKSFGKDLLGVRVLQKNGYVLRPVRAFGRAVFVTFLGGPSLLWVPFSRRNAAVHDLALQTEVVHDWANLPAPEPEPEPTLLLVEPVPESPASVSTGSLAGAPEFRNSAPTG
jgi:uncharacterized RDD family membrane protein YckC